MKIKTFKLPEVSGNQTIFLPNDCWILGVQYRPHHVYIDAMVPNDNSEMTEREFCVIPLQHKDYYSKLFTNNIDDLLFIDSCESDYVKYYVFAIEPKDEDVISEQ